MSKIEFEAKVYKIDTLKIVSLPQSVSGKLPSRGMNMVEGTINDFPFIAALEPDGKGGHWLNLDEKMSKGAKADADDIVKLKIEPVKEWPDPKVPEDLKKALEENKKVNSLWKEITPMARWEWIRWIRGTKQQETRERRIKVACSKLKSGMRRPCCFNRNMCTIVEVSKNGVLLAPTQTH